MPRPEFVTITRHVYLQILGRLAYLESIYGTTPVTVDMPDPGINSIALTENTAISIEIGMAGPIEITTVADPIFSGQMLSLVVGTTLGGTRAFVFDHTINKTGDNTITFNGLRDYALLRGMIVGVNYRWQLVSSESVVLS